MENAPPPPPVPVPEPIAIPEWTVFFESLVTQFTAPEKVYSITCNNHLDNFRVKTLTVKTEENTFKASVQYLIIHCDADASMTYEFPSSFASLVDVFSAFYHLLWTSTLCSECFNIVSVPGALCLECYPARIYHHFGMAHNLSLGIPSCPICFEQVYHAKLHCGHYVHRTCFVKMNSDRWFTYEMEIKCPICRAVISTQDRYDFFLWYG